MELEGVGKFYRAPRGLQCPFPQECGIGQPLGAGRSTRPMETEPGPQIKQRYENIIFRKASECSELL